MKTIAIVGAGLAGATAVTELRDQGHEGPIVLFGTEAHLPYERPPLSKGYLLGNDPLEQAYVHDDAWYRDHDVDLRRATTVTVIDTDAKVLGTADGVQAYDGLLIATGSVPRHLAAADSAASSAGTSVAYLRTIEDSDRIRSAFGAGKRIVVIGAGWIGLEVASAARQSETDVTVFEMANLPLERVLGPQIGQAFADLHRSHGVDLRLGTAFTPEDLAGADLVVVGVGVSPATALAEQAGLTVVDGIEVDQYLRTSAADVYAVGDVASQDHPVLRQRIRVEHWDTAIEQAKVAARNLLGANEVYDRLPYFFSDQYDVGLEYVGHGGPDAEVRIEGSLEDLSFRAYWVQDGLVTAGMHVNDWDAIDIIRDKVGKPAD